MGGGGVQGLGLSSGSGFRGWVPGGGGVGERFGFQSGSRWH